MVLPSSRGHGSGQIHASNDLDQYLASTQSSLSSLDSVESQHGEFLSTNAQDLNWFTDFIRCDSDEPESLADFTSALEASYSVGEDLTSGMTGTPLFTLSPNLVSADNSSFYAWRDSTWFDDSDLAVDCSSTMRNSEWSTMESAFSLYASSHSGSVSDAISDQLSPDHVTPAGTDAVPKLSMPRLRYFKCPTCNNPFSSEYRLSEHLRKSHASVQFICTYCNKGFKLKKDLSRHRLVHKPEKLACACGKKYARHDGLLRHVAKRPNEAGSHKAVEPNSE